MKTKPLTRRQAEALEFIKSFVSSKGYPPTVREIADHMGHSSSSTTFHILEALVRKGCIKKGNKPRELQIIGFVTGDEKDREITRLQEALQRIAGMDIIGSSAITMKNIAIKTLQLSCS
ncbi:LexA repressor [compost metagenome]